MVKPVERLGGHYHVNIVGLKKGRSIRTLFVLRYLADPDSAAPGAPPVEQQGLHALRRRLF